MKRGFTLVELMIVVVILGILASVVLGGMKTCANGKRGRARATDDAAAWVRQNHPDWVNTQITCTSVPTNGMVECDVTADVTADVAGVEVTLSCAYTVVREDIRTCTPVRTHR